MDRIGFLKCCDTILRRTCCFPVATMGDNLRLLRLGTPEVWVRDWGSGEFGFPLLSGAGRLVIKDIVILASAVVLLSDSSQRVLKTLKKD